MLINSESWAYSKYCAIVVSSPNEFCQGSGMTKEWQWFQMLQTSWHVTFLIYIIHKHQYLSLKQKRYSKKKNAIPLYFEKPFKTSPIISYYFSCHIHFVSIYLFLNLAKHGIIAQRLDTGKLLIFYK